LCVERKKENNIGTQIVAVIYDHTQNYRQNRQGPPYQLSGGKGMMHRTIVLSNLNNYWDSAHILGEQSVLPSTFKNRKNFHAKSVMDIP
jgi:hypothetical protein